MTDYVPPLRDIRFVLEQLADLPGLCKLGAFAHVDPDTVAGVIEESGRFAAGVVGPLNRVGDTVGCELDSAGNLRLFGLVLGGWLMARSALAAFRMLSSPGGPETIFLHEKISTARFYAQQLLPQVSGRRPAVTVGAEPLFAVGLSAAR